MPRSLTARLQALIRKSDLRNLAAEAVYMPNFTNQSFFGIFHDSLVGF